MNELHAVLAWVAGMEGDLACGICQVVGTAVHADPAARPGLMAAKVA